MIKALKGEGMKQSFVAGLACVLAISMGVAAMSQDKKDSQQKPKEVTTASGLKYTDLVVGKGDEAKKGDTVSVNYTGWLYVNGKRGDKFDSSIGRAPFEVQVGQGRVIRGWDEGLQGMRVGGKRELIIPPDLGYGARGAGGVIPPNATLDFEVELLKISK
jgi:FKBP-type peptidyl-prolyl cis-trans isomerase